MTIIHHVINREDWKQEKHKKGNSHILIRLRLHHHSTVFAQWVIGITLLKEVGINRVIVFINLPFVQCQCCHSTLITYVEDDTIVHRQAIMIPLNLCRNDRKASKLLHQLLSFRTKLEIMEIQIVTTCVCISQCLTIGTIDIWEVSRVCIDASKGVIVLLCKGSSLVAGSCRTCLSRQEGGGSEDESQQDTTDTLWQAEEETASLVLLALYTHLTNREYLTNLLVFIDDTITIHQSKTMRSTVFLVMDWFMVEDVLLFFLSESAARIGNRYLNIVRFFNGWNGHLTAFFSKFTSIISQCIHHEKRQNAVGFDDSFRVFYT